MTGSNIHIAFYHVRVLLQLFARRHQRQQPRTVLQSGREEQKGERVQPSGVGHLLQQPLLLVRVSSRE